MSKIDLEKRAEKIRIVLEKRQVRQVPPIRVSLALDISGSAQPLYRNGIIQDTVSRLVPLAMRFDDNGEMDMWSFTTDFDRLATVTAGDYADYVKREILDNRDVTKWGGTSYAPVMQDVLNHYFIGGSAAAKVSGFLGGFFGRKPKPAPAAAPADADAPAMCLFVTDGANGDRADAKRVLELARRHPIYWQMIGVGDPSEFRFIEEMADALPNVGFVNLQSLDISDESLYDQLINEELCAWVKAR